MRALRLLLACALLVLVALAPGREASANGRFPAADWFVAGFGNRRLVLRTTFGLVMSLDGGRSWGWVCEQALSRGVDIVPPVAVGGDGTLVVGVPEGIHISETGCDWAPPRGSPTTRAIDLAQDATGRVMVAAVNNTAGDAVLLSSDHGRSWALGAATAGLFIETVEVAPAMPQRVYVSGYLGGSPVILRSDDGGRMLRETTRDFGGLQSVYIAGVDPTNADVIYARSPDIEGTWLLRSDDGGAMFRRVTRTMGDMKGFAVSEDGATVWVGSSRRNEGLQRSVRGGPFVRVGAEVSVRCLRYRGGVLFVCADDVADGYALGCSTNGGDRIDPLITLQDVPGPLTCAAGTQVSTLCTPAWPAQQMTLRMVGRPLTGPRPVHDAGGGDVPVDAGAGLDAAPDADERDVSVVVDAGARDAVDEDARTERDVPAVTDVPRDAPLDRVEAREDASTLDVRDVPSFDLAEDRGTERPPRGTCDCNVVGTTDGRCSHGGTFGILCALITWKRIRRRRVRIQSLSG